MGVGQWFAYVAEKGWNRTGIGVAFYDDTGNLAGAQFTGMDEAIRRGDLPDTPISRLVSPAAPSTLKDMENRLETLSNAMSITRWTGGLPSLVWDEGVIERTFNYVTGQE